MIEVLVEGRSLKLIDREDGGRVLSTLSPQEVRLLIRCLEEKVWAAESHPRTSLKVLLRKSYVWSKAVEGVSVLGIFSINGEDYLSYLAHMDFSTPKVEDGTYRYVCVAVSPAQIQALEEYKSTPRRIFEEGERFYQYTIFPGGVRSSIDVIADFKEIPRKDLPPRTIFRIHNPPEHTAFIK